MPGEVKKHDGYLMEGTPNDWSPDTIERSRRPTVTYFYLTRLYLEARAINHFSPIPDGMLLALITRLAPLAGPFTELQKRRYKNAAAACKAAFVEASQQRGEATRSDQLNANKDLKEMLREPTECNIAWNPPAEHMTLRWMLMTVILLARRNLLLVLDGPEMQLEWAHASYDAWVMCRLWRFEKLDALNGKDENSGKEVYTWSRNKDAKVRVDISRPVRPPKDTWGLAHLQPLKNKVRPTYKGNGHEPIPAVEVKASLKERGWKTESVNPLTCINLYSTLDTGTSKDVKQYLRELNRLKEGPGFDFKLDKNNSTYLDVWTDFVPNKFDDRFPVKLTPFPLAFVGSTLCDLWVKRTVQITEAQTKAREFNNLVEDDTSLVKLASKLPWSDALQLPKHTEVQNKPNNMLSKLKHGFSRVFGSEGKKPLDVRTVRIVDEVPSIGFELHPVLHASPRQRVEPLSPLDPQLESEKTVLHAGLGCFLAASMAGIVPTYGGATPGARFPEYRRDIQDYKARLKSLTNDQKNHDARKIVPTMSWDEFSRK